LSQPPNGDEPISTQATATPPPGSAAGCARSRLYAGRSAESLTVMGVDHVSP
jgi:hypothetical protein